MILINSNNSFFRITFPLASSLSVNAPNLFCSLLLDFSIKTEESVTISSLGLFRKKPIKPDKLNFQDLNFIKMEKKNILMIAGGAVVLLIVIVGGNKLFASDEKEKKVEEKKPVAPVSNIP